MAVKKFQVELSNRGGISFKVQPKTGKIYVNSNELLNYENNPTTFNLEIAGKTVSRSVLTTGRTTISISLKATSSNVINEYNIFDEIIELNENQPNGFVIKDLGN